MALWHMLERNIKGIWVPEGECWDDGDTCKPGEEGFSVTAVIAQAAGRMYNYICTHNWDEQGA